MRPSKPQSKSQQDLSWIDDEHGKSLPVQKFEQSQQDRKPCNCGMDCNPMHPPCKDYKPPTPDLDNKLAHTEKSGKGNTLKSGQHLNNLKELRDLLSCFKYGRDYNEVELVQRKHVDNWLEAMLDYLNRVVPEIIGKKQRPSPTALRGGIWADARNSLRAEQRKKWDEIQKGMDARKS